MLIKEPSPQTNQRIEIGRNDVLERDYAAGKRRGLE
jgi:hypothetical protein